MEGRPAAAHAHGCRPRQNEAPLTGCSGGTKGSERRQLPGARTLAGPRRQRMRALARSGASAATALAGAEPTDRRQRGLVRLRSGGRESGLLRRPSATDGNGRGGVFSVDFWGIRYRYLRRVARAVAGSDASDWVRRCSAVTSATPPVHAGQCWPTGDLLVLLAGCGSKSCQYHGSRQAIPHGLQLPGELPMPPARRAITLARSQMRAPAFLCRRRADATTFSASTSCPLRYAAMIPRSQQSLPPRVSRRA